MKKILGLLVLALMATVDVKAVEECPLFEIPELKIEYGFGQMNMSPYLDVMLSSENEESGNSTEETTHETNDFVAYPSGNMSGDWISFSNQSNPGVNPYKVMDDLSLVGVPIFLAGIVAKSEKKAFRQDYKNPHANTRLITHFKTEIDNYTQYFGPTMVLGLKLAGVEGRSTWPRLLASTAMSYGIMAAFVNGIKYTAKEMRPDGSTANSWPSGHTATSFVGATLLHHEYGMTRSPWYSIAGFGVATATGIMRVLNNRHWVSDVMSGAGIGIMSTELAYALSDIIFKDKGLLRGPLNSGGDIINNPSFFSISMGIGLGGKTLDFNAEDYVEPEPLEDNVFADDEDEEDYEAALDGVKLKFQASTVFNVEGAYFFNKYVGVGGRLRIKSSPIKGWSNLLNQANSDMGDMLKQVAEDEEEGYRDLITDYELNIVSDHLTEFSFDLGGYFNIPLSSRFALGSKLLFGRSVMQELDLDAKFTGNKKTFGFEFVDNDSDPVQISLQNTGEQYTSSWDFLTVDASTSFKVGTGISLTYAYKDYYSWRLFMDYDFTRKTYSFNYNPVGYLRDAIDFPIPDLFTYVEHGSIERYSKKKSMHSFVLGLSFVVTL
ncbi:MAG: phosphatase PAP2 family protein [Bacteroidaceae bacterium]|nr:phosphatase PAP2 family protein [Bacteroidaceae bacterium]